MTKKFISAGGVQYNRGGPHRNGSDPNKGQHFIMWQPHSIDCMNPVHNIQKVINFT